MASLLEKSIWHAAHLYSGQFRIGGRPAFSHALGTLANLVAFGERDENVLCAGVLHDTIEDAGLTKTQLADEYNQTIADLVAQVTQDEQKRFALTTAGGFELKMADRLDNLNDLTSCKAQFKKKQAVKTARMLSENPRPFCESNPALFAALLKKTVRLLEELGTTLED